MSFPYRYHPDAAFGGAWHIDWATSNPNYMAATLAPPTNFDPSKSGYSTDAGLSWTPFATRPLGSTNALTTFGIGCVAVGDPGHIVWVSSQSHGGQYTLDHGTTWTALTLPGISDYTKLNNSAYYFYRRTVAADRQTPDIYYIHVIDSGFYRSTNAGVTWTQMSDNGPWALPGYYNEWASHAVLKAVPGNEGHLFMATGRLDSVSNGVFLRTLDGGDTWTVVTGMTTVRTFGFGMHAPGETYPAIYVCGLLNGVYGLYRSDDNCDTWKLLTNAPDGSLDKVRCMDGDKDEYGTFYLGTTGRGWIKGYLA